MSKEKTHSNAVQFTGAPAGSLLVGYKEHNKGLVVRVEEEQNPRRSKGKSITGNFTILSPSKSSNEDYSNYNLFLCNQVGHTDNAKYFCEEFHKDYTSDKDNMKCQFYSNTLKLYELWLVEKLSTK